MYQFDEDTSLVKTGEGVYLGRVSAGYNIGDVPNGGYLIAMTVCALMQELVHQDPMSITTHFLRPGIADCDCEVRVQLLRQGRTLSTVRASLLQEGKVRLEVLAAMGNLKDSTGFARTVSMPRPDLPAPDACMLRKGDLQGIELPIMQRLEVRLGPVRLQQGRQIEAELTGYVRFTDGRPVDLLALLMFPDVFPPSSFALLGKLGWVPTIELTVHLRNIPEPGWISSQLRTDDLTGGRMIESGCLWDSSGKLVAQSRQLGLIMPGN